MNRPAVHFYSVFKSRFLTLVKGKVSLQGSERVTYRKHPLLVVASQLAGVPGIEHAGKIVDAYVIMLIDIQTGAHLESDVAFRCLHIAAVFQLTVEGGFGIGELFVKRAAELDLEIRAEVNVPAQVVLDIEME